MSINVIGTEKREFYQTDGDEVSIDGNLLIDSTGVMQHGIQITALGQIKFKESYQNQTYLKPLYGATKIQPIMLTSANENILKPAYIPRCHNRKIPFSFPLLANKDTLLYDTYHGKYIKIKYKIKFSISKELQRCEGSNYELVIQKNQIIDDSEQLSYIEPLEFILDTKLRSKGSIISYITNIYGYAEKDLDNVDNLNNCNLPDNDAKLDNIPEDSQSVNENTTDEKEKLGTGSLIGYIYSYKGYLTKKTPKDTNLAEKQPIQSVKSVNDGVNSGLKVNSLLGSIYSFTTKNATLEVKEPLSENVLQNESANNKSNPLNCAPEVGTTVVTAELEENMEPTEDSLLVDPLTSGIYTINPTDNEQILGEILTDEIHIGSENRELNSSTCNLFENYMSTEDLNTECSDLETSFVEDNFSDEMASAKIKLDSKQFLEVDYSTYKTTKNGRRSLDSLKTGMATTQIKKGNSRRSLESSEAKTRTGNEQIANKHLKNTNTVHVIITGVLDSKICPIDNPLTGEVTVVHKSVIIESIEVELLALETCGKGYKPDESLIKVHQIAVGNICSGRSIPFHLMFPPLLTCPTVKTDTFKIEFAVRIVVLMKDFQSVSKTIPIDVIRI